VKTFVVGDVHGRCAQLQNLLEMLPRDESTDTLVFLGDLIDRGLDAPGCVELVAGLCRDNPRVICLRGNHEQMLLDFIAGDTDVWIAPVTGGEYTFHQYTGRMLRSRTETELEESRGLMAESLPPAHLDFFQHLPHYHEDDYAIYVHAGLEQGKHPRESRPQALLWMRDMDFFKNYRGKPCIFGHTPTPLLPLRGRLGRHGLYISHSAVGLDTGYNMHSPLSCLELPDFMLYQTFADGRAETHQITSFIPDKLRQMKLRAATGD